MDLGLSDEERVLKASTRTAISRASATGGGTEGRVSADAWSELGSGGLLAAVLPASHAGGGLQAACLIAEELGRAAAITPLMGIVGLVLEMLAERQDDVRSIIEGKVRVSPVVYGGYGELGEHLPRLWAVPGGYVLHGRSALVPDGDRSDTLLVHTAADGEDLLVQVPIEFPGVHVRQRATTGKGPQSVVTFDRVQLATDSYVVGGEKARVAVRNGLARAWLLQAAYMVGQADRVAELTAKHVQRRVQFDRPLSTFQSVQHILADLFVARQSARRLVEHTAWSGDSDQLNRSICAEAKLYAIRTVRRATRAGHELHGGVAAVDDHEISIHHRRAVDEAALFGGVYELRPFALPAIGQWPEL